MILPRVDVGVWRDWVRGGSVASLVAAGASSMVGSSESLSAGDTGSYTSVGRIIVDSLVDAGGGGALGSDLTVVILAVGKGGTASTGCCCNTTSG